MTALPIDCPECGHQHELPEGSFEGQDSALFQCAACQHVWRYYTRPLADYEKQLFEVSPAHKPPAQTINIMRGLTNKSAYQKAIHNYYMDWWILTVAVVIVIIALYREVGQIPNLGWFYTQIEDRVSRVLDTFSSSEMNYDDIISTTVLTSNLDRKEGVSTLTIKAQLSNTSNRTLTVPPIKVEIFDRNETGVWGLRTSWTEALTDVSIEAGASRVIEVAGPTPKHALPGSVALTFAP